MTSASAQMPTTCRGQMTTPAMTCCELHFNQWTPLYGPAIPAIEAPSGVHPCCPHCCCPPDDRPGHPYICLDGCTE